jgi:hypothetical protein
MFHQKPCIGSQIIAYCILVGIKRQLARSNTGSARIYKDLFYRLCLSISLNTTPEQRFYQ